MSINKRLKMVIEDNGMSIKEFSELCDIPYRSIQNYLLGERNIGADALKKVCTRLGININWLLTGEGSMYRLPQVERKFLDTLVEWLTQFQEEADEKQIIWLEVQIKKCFPEYVEWVQRREKEKQVECVPQISSKNTKL